MASTNFRNSIANGYLIVANILNTIEIEKLVVPELVVSGSDVVLDCQYSVTDDHVTVRWLFNGNNTPIYQWTPQTLPLVDGVLKGRIDLSYKASLISSAERRALRILQVDPRLSGEYTCVIIKNGVERRQSKNMLVYSPEVEFKLEINGYDKLIQTTCSVQGVYPIPELTVEYNNKPITQQLQRVWPSNEALYDAETSGKVSNFKCGNSEITCRLNLPQADYTAIKKRIIDFDKTCNDVWKLKPFKLIVVITLVNLVYIL